MTEPQFVDDTGYEEVVNELVKTLYRTIAESVRSHAPEVPESETTIQIETAIYAACMDVGMTFMKSAHDAYMYVVNYTEEEDIDRRDTQGSPS